MRSVATPLLAMIFALASCNRAATEATIEPGAEQMDNVLLAEWAGPYGGVPAFDQMDLAVLEPAMKRGIELHLAELDAIAANSEPPTFDNTIVAMERPGTPSSESRSTTVSGAAISPPRSFARSRSG